jgi:hypothetical protein
MNNVVKLNLDELKDFLRHIVVNNQHIQKEGKIPVAVNIEGEAGLGKTSSLLQLAEELNMQIVKLSLSQIEELGDLVGFPVKEFEMVKDDGKKVWIQDAVMPMYIQAKYKPTGEKRMTHAAPEWIQGRGEGGFLILDDYTRADHRFMQASMEIIDRQEYISWRLPKNWHVVLTTNPDNGNYQVTSLDNAQKTRFITVETKFDIEVWARWAEKVNIDTRCINFLLLNPELVTDKLNPRSITTFFNSISCLESFDDSLPIIQMIGEGSVGNEFASMFSMFINNKLDKLLSPKDIFTKDMGYILGTIRSNVGRGDNYRADIASVMGTRIVNYSLMKAENGPISPDMISRIIALTTDEELFTKDIKYFIVRALIAGNKQKFQKILTNPELVKMTAS